MADYKYDAARKPLYLYNLPDNVVSTLVPTRLTSSTTTAAAAAADDNDNVSQHDDGASDTASSAASSAASPAQTDRTCALCNMDFATSLDKRGHLKADLHYYNLKQKIRGLPSVTEAEFEKLADGMDESLSGEDWSEEEEENDGPKTGLATLLQRQAVISSARKTHGDGNATDNNDNTPRQTKQKRAAAEAAAALQPFVWFSSPTLPAHHYFGVYRAMLTPEELNGKRGEEGGQDKDDGDDDEAAWSARMARAISTRQLPPLNGAVVTAVSSAAAAAASATNSTTTSSPLTLPPDYNGRHIFLCMIGGGHFAAMVVALPPRRSAAAAAAASASASSTSASSSVPMNREAVVLAHKTFHRYTTRRKQGGSQSANDNAKGAAHSAGSSLRRYNEQALVDDVRGLLRDWQPLLDTADLLFVRATGSTNQRTLFGPYDGQVLAARDPRLRSFPFNTRRATQKEIMRAFIELTRLKVREIVPRGAEEEEEVGSMPVVDEAVLAERQRQKEAAAKRREEEETALLHTSQLQGLARRSKVPALLAYLQTNGLSATTFRFHPPDAGANHHAPTLLHLAASQNAPALVSALLLRAGADPTVCNGDGKTAFELAGDRATRNAFRVARGEMPAAGGGIDWDAARVPPPLTRAEAEQREAADKQEAARKEAERRQAEEARLKREAAADAAKKSGSSTTQRKKHVLPAKSAQEAREEEARGLTPEQRLRLERERRARAAEARMRAARGGQ